MPHYCHFTAFWLWAFDLPLDQFSALSKPISQSQSLTWVSGNREGHWQYHWTQIICQCKHLDKTDMVWPTHSHNKQQAERGKQLRSDQIFFSCAERLGSIFVLAQCHTGRLVFSRGRMKIIEWFLAQTVSRLYWSPFLLLFPAIWRQQVSVSSAVSNCGLHFVQQAPNCCKITRNLGILVNYYINNTVNQQACWRQTHWKQFAQYHEKLQINWNFLVR